MLGSIIGDIAGSTYEFTGNKRMDVPLFPAGSSFTDDTIMVIATADALLGDGDFAKSYRRWGAQYQNPMGAYGARFAEWLSHPSAPPYNSWGNGSAMRVSPVAWACSTLDDTVAKARQSAAVTHNHPEGIKGAESTAAGIWLARHGASKDEIRRTIADTYGYDLSRSCDVIRPTYQFCESCQQTVPQAFTAFFDSTDFESAIRLAISLGGDADTLGCITGGLAHAFYGSVPIDHLQSARQLLAREPDLNAVVETFLSRFAV
jgi:ADP-ribosylglycohydrolase